MDKIKDYCTNIKERCIKGNIITTSHSSGYIRVYNYLDNKKILLYATGSQTVINTDKNSEPLLDVINKCINSQQKL